MVFHPLTFARSHLGRLQHLLSDVPNVNAIENQVDHYHCIHSIIYSPKFKKSMALYSVYISQSTGGRTFY